MFLIIIILLLILLYFDGFNDGGVNRTTEFAWDFTNWIFFLKYGTWLIFVVGYGVLALLRTPTNKALSILHLTFIILTIISGDFINYLLFIVLTINLISVVIFSINFIWSLRNRKNIKSENVSI